MSETERMANTSRIQLAFMIDSELTKEELKSVVETAREKAEPTSRDRIEYTRPIKVKAPLPTFAFIGGLASFAATVVEQLVAGYKGGTIIDLQEILPVISRDPNGTTGRIRVLVTDGTNQIEAPSADKSTLDATLQGILSLPLSMGAGGTTKADIARVVKAAKTEQKRAGNLEREAVAS